MQDLLWSLIDGSQFGQKAEQAAILHLLWREKEASDRAVVL